MRTRRQPRFESRAELHPGAVGVFDLLRRFDPAAVPMTPDGPDVASLASDLIRSHDVDYMERFFLLGSAERSGATARYHHLLTSDQDPHLHDHPWDFISIILQGSYVETTPDGETEYGPGTVLPRCASAAHRLTLSRPVWTFVVTGPARRRWGFHTDDGWVHWRTYLGQNEATATP